MSIFSKFIDSMKITEDEDEVNEFYKKMLKDGVKIIDDGDKKFIYSLL